MAKSYQINAAHLTAAAPALWIYDERILGGRGLERPALVWRTEVTSTVDPLLRELVLVDAKLGNVALAFSQVHPARERQICDLRQRARHERERNEQLRRSRPSMCAPKASPRPPSPTSTRPTTTPAIPMISSSPASAATASTVPACPCARSCATARYHQRHAPYPNAAWNGEVMYYGTGFTAGDDVVGHELAHGVTEFTSNLFYYYQSGAINESLSDVFGELVDLTNGRGTDTPAVRWQLGEDLPASIGVIRDMEDPTVFERPGPHGQLVLHRRPQRG